VPALRVWRREAAGIGDHLPDDPLVPSADDGDLMDLVPDRLNRYEPGPNATRPTGRTEHIHNRKPDYLHHIMH
jgi:hypothetical protein